MKEILNVRGSQINKPLKLEVNKDTVYLRTNIQRIEEEDFVGWQYDEVQYDLKEYIELIGNENEELNKSVDLLEDFSVANMVAMTEMFEEKLELENKNTQTMVAITEIYELLVGGL